jgi:hypothetical protein
VAYFPFLFESYFVIIADMGGRPQSPGIIRGKIRRYVGFKHHLGIKEL